MKKLIYTLCLFTGMAISSCEDWLARDPLDQIADVNLTYTADECKLYVNQFYTSVAKAGELLNGEKYAVSTFCWITVTSLPNRKKPANTLVKLTSSELCSTMNSFCGSLAVLPGLIKHWILNQENCTALA